jgi:hypothetical protein
MPTSSAVLSRSASDLLEVRDLAPVDSAFADEFQENTDSRTPVRVALQLTSDFSFVDSLVASTVAQLTDLAGAGDWEDLARGMVAIGLEDPAVRMQTSAGSEIRVLQAVVLRGSEEQGLPLELSVCVRVNILPQHFQGKSRIPPTVTMASVDVTMRDTSSTSEVLQLVNDLIRWRSEFPVPVDRSVRGTTTVALLGDPTHLCIGDVPVDWRTRLGEILAAFDRRATIAGDGSRFSGDLPANTVMALVFDPYAGHEPRLPPDVDLTPLPTRELTFGDVELAICDALCLLAESAEDEVIDAELIAGRTIFHRKIGSSRHFDRFDSGSPDPCKHGIGSFKPWSGDKCVKGFQRRYADFQPSMLQHCGKFPNCGVYAVFG